MAKFALIVAVAFVAQASAFQFGPAGALPKLADTPLCTGKVEIPEVALQLNDNFEAAINEMDSIREALTTATLDSVVQGTNPEVIIACFRQQRKDYIALGRRIAGLMRKASKELAQELGDKFEKYGKKMQEPIRNIAITFKTFPQKMWNLIRNQEFGKVVELIKESRQTVIENARKLAKIIIELREELPKVAEKAEEMAREIRSEARKGAKEVRAAFRKCIEEGGPKDKVDVDADVDVDVDVDADVDVSVGF